MSPPDYPEPPTPTFDLPPCGRCGHRVHPDERFEVGLLGPRSFVGRVCFGCAVCSRTFSAMGTA